MCYARVAAAQINAYCRMKWPKEGFADMASTWANGSVIDAYDHEGGGSHKYIQADEFTEQLGEKQGEGVYGYWRMKDGSLLLRTCKGPLAWAKDGKAEWGEFA